MVTLTPIVCGPCGYEKQNQIAKMLCIVCKEGLCRGCENMHLTWELSEKHMLIKIEDCQKQIKINETCEEHQRKYEYYCKSHDKVICAECFQHMHDACAEVQIIEDAAHHIEISVGVPDSEESITECLKKLQVKILNDMQLKLTQTFIVNIKRKYDRRYVSGCLFLPTGDILIADYYHHDKKSNKVMLHNNDGKHIRDISVSYNPFDLTLVDSERVAILYGVMSSVDILNLTTNRIGKTFEHKSCCFGISYDDGRMYTLVDEHGIIVTDLLGKHLDTIKEGVVGATYITIDKHRIYVCSYISDTVKCYSKTGALLWIFSDDLLRSPSGLAIDSNGNILVVGDDSNNLTVITRDGKIRKILLNVENDLHKPKAIHYNKENNMLLVCNLENGKAFLYTVTYD